MTSSNVFSFYDPAEIAQAEAKPRVDITENVHKEAEVDVYDGDTTHGNDVRDEVDVVEEEMEEERSNVVVPTADVKGELEEERNNDAAPTEECNSVSICNKEEAKVDDVREADTIQDDDDVRDEADVVEGEMEKERINVAAPNESNRPPAEDLPSSNSGAKKNQWLDRANALNEIRMLLKEEIEQDSGEYFDWYK